MLAREIHPLSRGPEAGAPDPGFPGAVERPAGGTRRYPPGAIQGQVGLGAARVLMNPTLGNLAEAYVEGAIDLEGPIADMVGIADQLADTSGTTEQAQRTVQLVRPAHPRHRPQGHPVSLRRLQRVLRDLAGSSHGLFVRLFPQWRRRSCHRPGRQSSTSSAASSNCCRRNACSTSAAAGERWSSMRPATTACAPSASHSRRSSSSSRASGCNAAGLEDRIDIRLQDYRDVADGPYDKISSIGMFEHVGLKNLGKYFRNRLQPAARGWRGDEPWHHGQRHRESWRRARRRRIHRPLRVPRR